MRWIIISRNKIFCHGILKNDNNEILILKRAKKDLYPNLWDLPGGFKETGETYEQCVIREFKEETNLDVKIEKLEKIKTQNYNNEIIVVLLYSVVCQNIENIKLDASHILFKFDNKIDSKDAIWYLQDFNLKNEKVNTKDNKINYLFSGINKELGFNNEQSIYLKKDIPNNSTITFIASTFDDYKTNDYYVEKTLNYFKKINIEFCKQYIVDNRTNKIYSKKNIENSDVVYLLGGNPENQMKMINDYDLKSILQTRNGITIGVSAGAMNQAKHIVYKDEFQNNTIFDYEGIGLTDVYVYPHLDTNSVEFLNEILEISKYVKLYALPNDSFIRVENGDLKIIGEYYTLGD